MPWNPKSRGYLHLAARGKSIQVASLIQRTVADYQAEVPEVLSAKPAPRACRLSPVVGAAEAGFWVRPGMILIRKSARALRPGGMLPWVEGTEAAVGEGMAAGDGAGTSARAGAGVWVFFQVDGR